MTAFDIPTWVWLVLALVFCLVMAGGAGSDPVRWKLVADGYEDGVISYALVKRWGEPEWSAPPGIAGGYEVRICRGTPQAYAQRLADILNGDR